jgi:cyclic pyranopterin phosphate synthase
MIDPYGRAINYLRVSVTDRCDFRCQYCMPEQMAFLPRAELLTLEELDVLCRGFIALGVRRLRITGGEPLMRRNVLELFERLGARLGDGLDELTLTTNGSQLARFAAALAQCGVRRINVSLDTLQADRFTAITRRGRLEQVLEGLREADAAGLAVKINAVALRGVNEDEFDAMIAWCGERGYDLCLIETMPMGVVDEDRTDRYLPLSLVRGQLRARWTLDPTQADRADLRQVLRGGGDLAAAIAEAISRKPKGHDFVIDRRQQAPSMQRHMSLTGG